MSKGMSHSQSLPDLGTDRHRCNARPINPFVNAEGEAQNLLREVFECEGWKVSRDPNKTKQKFNQRLV